MNSPISWRGGLRGPLTSITVGPRLHGNAKLPPVRDHRGAPVNENPSPALPYTPPTNTIHPMGLGSSRDNGTSAEPQTDYQVPKLYSSILGLSLDLDEENLIAS
ncbi:hypothetical protein N7465_003751 [Penicillium sp. CMV-2018d]|nr:hypothetical protein N7465_003751 [Penicillium sp. CMV-2018d]